MLHGRDLLKQGLVQSIGDGTSTNVWWDKWIIDKVPRSPNYRADSVVDLTLKVENLIDQQSGSWDESLVRQTFSPGDAKIILSTRKNPNIADKLIWAFTKSGEYTSKSGYKFLEIAAATLNPLELEVPPLEKKLWSELWKIKTSPKLKHFLWKVLYGALAVRTRLRTRGINIDPLCTACGRGSEGIAHVLFHCKFAKEVWSCSAIPMPPSGSWSNSVFLNLFHLMKCAKMKNLTSGVRHMFPWVLWHIWKARNEFCFEHTRLAPPIVFDKAAMEAEIWRETQSPSSVLEGPSTPVPTVQEVWMRPPMDWIKCNLASSWVPDAALSGAAWIARDEEGRVALHSRRAFPRLASPLTAELQALLWSVESLASHRFQRVIFETSSCDLRMALLRPELFHQFHALISAIMRRLRSFLEWSVDFVKIPRNVAARSIATSVTSDLRSQSYVASGGPLWLNDLLLKEASLGSSSST